MEGRHLAAILFTDIVGFTALMQHNEEEALHLMRHYRQVLEEQVGKFGGSIVNDYGDGNLCTFTSALEAVKCTVALQRCLQIEPVVPLRIGLHVGEMFIENGKALGDGINVASRVQSLGVANAVLLSSDVYRVIKNHPEFTVQSLGVFEFKNVDEPIEVYALVDDALVVPATLNPEGKLKSHDNNTQTAPNKSFVRVSILILAFITVGWIVYSVFNGRAVKHDDVKSIAVLPFVNMSDDASQDYFSNGITEDIINNLTRLSGMRVKSRTSSLSYKGSLKSTKDIGDELNVTHLLEGSVRKVGNTVRISVQLIDAQQDLQIWAASYDRELEDILTLQNDIAENIIRSLQVELNASDKAILMQTEAVDVTAYDYFLKAREEYNQITYDRRRYENSLQFINQALLLKPDYAQALALKGRLWLQVASFGIPMKIWRDSSLYYASRAIQADPLSPDGYICRAIVNRYLGNIQKAIEDLDQAYTIAPNNPEVLMQYGNQLLLEGKEEGAAMMIRSIEANFTVKDPDYFESWDAILYNTDNLSLREQLLLETKKLYPGSIKVRYELSNVYRELGEYEKSINELLTLKANNPEVFVEDPMGWAYFLDGNYSKAIDYWTRCQEQEATFSDTTQRLPYRHRLGMAYSRINENLIADSLVREQVKISKAQLARERNIGTANGTWGSRAGIHYDLATCEAYFGNRDKMLQHLDSAVFYYHFFWIRGIKNDPMWDPYQSDIQFIAFQKHFQEVVDFRKRAIEKALYNTNEGQRLLWLINWQVKS